MGYGNFFALPPIPASIFHGPETDHYAVFSKFSMIPSGSVDPMYHRQLLSGTRIIKHWAGRNSRGVTQYDGRSLEEIVLDFDESIDVAAAQDFLTKCLRA